MAVANNIASGRGIVRSSPTADGGLKPLVVQSPLYPLTIAALIRIGFFPETAALVIPALFLLASILLVTLVLYYWGGSLWAFIGTFIFVLSMPLYAVSVMAWTEPMFIFFCLSILVLSDFSLNETSGVKSTPVLHFSIGLLAGLAFATRYIGIVFFPFLALVYLWRYFATYDKKRILKEVAITFSCFSIIVIIILTRNYFVSHTLTGGPRPPSNESFWWNLRISLWYLRRDVFPLPIIDRFLFPQGFLLLISSPFVAIVGLSDRNTIRRLLPGIFCLIYLLTLCFLRAQSHFDAIGTRLLSPLFAVFIFWMASSFSSIIFAPMSESKELLRALTVVVVVVLMASQTSGLISVASSPLAAQWPGKEAGNWLSDNTASGETIISSRSHYLLRRLPNKLFFSIPRFPNEELSEGDLTRIAGTYKVRYLVLFKETVDNIKIKSYGQYLRRIYESKSSTEIMLEKETKDAFIFRIIGNGTNERPFKFSAQSGWSEGHNDI